MRQSTLCYIEKDGCYLMLHRIKKENDVNRDKWIGIGGGFEDRESPEECILRETEEETGLRLKSLSYRGIITFVSDIYETEYMHLFTSDSFDGEMTDCDEGVLEWIPKSSFKSLNLWEGDYIFLRLIEDKGLPFFSLKLTYLGDKLDSAILNGQRID